MRTIILIVILASFASAFSSPVSAETLERADGSEITYHLLGSDDQQQRGIILMLQGSGCDPVIERDWLVSEPLMLAPAHSVLAIEKYGVAEDEPQPADLVEGCSLAYWSRNTLQQRVLDTVQVIARLRRETWWNRDLIIYGGSEGGAVAALVAPLVPETRAVVIMSSGIGVSVVDLISSAVPPPVAAKIPEIIREAKANPTATQRFGGASYRWWADSADIVPAKALLQTDAPVLLIHGTSDQFAPVATAREARDMLLKAGKCNFAYLEYSGYNHYMVDEAGIDHKRDVLNAVAEWLVDP